MSQRFELKDGRVLKIEQDETALDPRRDFDNVGTMVLLHKRYNLGDKHGYRSGDYAGWHEMGQQIIGDNEGDVCVILPVFMYDHSGVSLSCGVNQFAQMDPAGFDSGQVGWIYVTNTQAMERMGTTDVDEVTRVLMTEVELYSQYLGGEVYWFGLEKPVECDSCGHVEWETIDSCGGFYGSDPKTNGMTEHLPKDVVDELWPEAAASPAGAVN